MNSDLEKIRIEGTLIPKVRKCPIDIRTVVDSFDDIPNIEKPFVGMMIYVKDDRSVYLVRKLSTKTDMFGIESDYIKTNDPESLVKVVDSSNIVDLINGDVTIGGPGIEKRYCVGTTTAPRFSYNTTDRNPEGWTTAKPPIETGYEYIWSIESELEWNRNSKSYDLGGDGWSEFPTRETPIDGIKGDKGDKGDPGDKGDKGDIGNKGDKGDPAYSVFLSNSSYNFVKGKNETISLTVESYKGGTKIPAKINSISYIDQDNSTNSELPTGISVNIIDTDFKKSPKFEVSINDTFTLAQGRLNINITTDGYDFNLSFLWTVVVNGAKGDKGDKGDTGDAGASAKVITLSASDQAFVYSNNFASLDSPTDKQITITATAQNVTSWKWMYSVGGSSEFTEIPNSLNNHTYTVIPNDPAIPNQPVDIFSNNNSITIKCVSIDDDTINDTISLFKITSGANGKDGDGRDGCTVQLSNESHIFEGDTEKAIYSSIDCYVIAYKGNDPIVAAIGEITGAPNGMNVTVINDTNNPGQSRFVVTVSEETNNPLTTTQGVLNIPVRADEKDFNLKFSWILSLSKKGDPAKLIRLNTDYNVIKYKDNFFELIEPDKITLEANLQNVNSCSWSYKNSSSSSYTPIINDTNIYELPSNKYDEFFGNDKMITIRCIDDDDENIKDEVTITKLSDGATGGKGEDSVTIILTNESHTFTGDDTAAIESDDNDAFCEIVVFKGSEKIATSIGNITAVNGNIPTGMSIVPKNSVIDDNGNIIEYASFTVHVTHDLTDRSGQLNIPIIADEQTYNKLFSWSLSLAGSKGDKGDKGDTGDKGDKGDTGDSAKLIRLTTDNGFSFMYNDNFNDDNLTGPENITITAQTQSVNLVKWEYKNSSQTNWTSLSVSNDVKTYTLNYNSPLLENSDYIKIKCSDLNDLNLYDIITINKISNNNGYTVQLENESHIFKGDSTSAIGESITSDIIAYKGRTPVAVTIASIQALGTLPTGMTVTFKNSIVDAEGNITENASFTINVTKDLTAKSGMLTINMYVDNVYILKTFSWVLSLDGKDAKNYELDASDYFFMYNNNFKELVGPESIKITANFPDTSEYNWSYNLSDSLDEEFTTITGVTGSSFTLLPVDPNNSNNGTLFADPDNPGEYKKIITIKCSSGEISDHVTIRRITNGSDGQDSYNSLLTNQNHTFIGTTNHAKEAFTETNIVAYKANNKVSTYVDLDDNTIKYLNSDNSTEKPNGMEVEIIDNNTNHTKIKISVDESLTIPQGTITFPVLLNGEIYHNLTFSWNISFMGQDGEPAKLIRLITDHDPYVYDSETADEIDYPYNVVITASCMNIENCIWLYKQPQQSDFQELSLTYINGLTCLINYDSDIFGEGNKVQILCKDSSNNDIYDIITIHRKSDEYSILIDNENHTFVEGIAEEISSEIKVIKYGEQFPVTITNIIAVDKNGESFDLPGSMTVISKNSVIDDNGNIIENASFTISVTDRFNISKGKLLMSIIADEKEFDVEFGWVLALKGTDGEPAKSLEVHADAHAFSYFNDFENLAGPQQITVKAILHNLEEGYKWSYKNDIMNGFKVISSATGSTYVINSTTNIFDASAITRPDDELLQPGDEISQPNNGISQPGDEILQPSVTKATSVTVRCTSTHDSSIYDEVTIIRTSSGKTGGDGKNGKMMYFAGEFNPDTTYTISETAIPYVYDDSGKTIDSTVNTYYYLVSDSYNASEHNNETPYQNSQNTNASWKKLPSFDFLYSKIGNFDIATVGPAVFKGNYVFSQKDINGGGEYQSFDGDPVNGVFKPALWFNFSTGEGSLARGNIKWDANGNTTLGENVSISWNNIDGAPNKNDILTKSTKITGDMIETQSITADKINTENLTVTKLETTLSDKGKISIRDNDIYITSKDENKIIATITGGSLEDADLIKPTQSELFVNNTPVDNSATISLIQGVESTGMFCLGDFTKSYDCDAIIQDDNYSNNFISHITILKQYNSIINNSSEGIYLHNDIFISTTPPQNIGETDKLHYNANEVNKYTFISKDKFQANNSYQLYEGYIGNIPTNNTVITKNIKYYVYYRYMLYSLSYFNINYTNSDYNVVQINWPETAGIYISFAPIVTDNNVPLVTIANNGFRFTVLNGNTPSKSFTMKSNGAVCYKSMEGSEFGADANGKMYIKFNNGSNNYYALGIKSISGTTVLGLTSVNENNLIL